MMTRPIVLLLFILLPLAGNSATIIDTGEPSGFLDFGASAQNFTYAVEIQLSEETTITSIKSFFLYSESEVGSQVTVGIFEEQFLYPDVNTHLPLTSASLTENFQFGSAPTSGGPSREGWEGVSNISWVLSAGTYWVGFYSTDGAHANIGWDVPNPSSRSVCGSDNNFDGAISWGYASGCGGSGGNYLPYGIPLQVEADVHLKAGSLISADHADFGPDSLTIDTTTNLVWLDLEHSDPISSGDYSYNYISTQFGAGGEFEGFRFASEDEVLALMSSGGMPDAPGTSTENVVPMTEFHSLVGTTDNGGTFSLGMTATPYPYAPETNIVTVYAQLQNGTGVVATSSTGRTGSNASGGAWLLKSAALETADDPVFGQGALTVDANSGLAWLDLSHTDGLSYNAVSAELGSGGQYSGFRYATEEEVLGFLSSAAIAELPGESANNIGPITNLHSYVGTTDSGSSFSLGITGTPHPTAGGHVVTVYAQLTTSGTGAALTSFTAFDSTNAASGSWLVKPAGTAPSDIDEDGVPDTSDICPSDPEDNCNPSGSAAEEIASTDGGTVSTPDGQLTLEVEAGDLAEDETLSVTEIVDEQVLADVVISDGSGQPLAMYVLEPDGTEFAQTVKLSINLDVTALSTEERNNLDIYLHEDTDGDTVPDTFVAQHAICSVTEAPAGIFTASCALELEHFSTYLVVAPKDSDGDGVFDDFDGIVDACPMKDSTGFDSDVDGCIDTITGLAELVSSLVSSGVIDTNMENSLLSKLANVQKSQDKDNVCAMVNQLEAFKSQVAAQTGKKISAEASGDVTAYADNVIAFVMLVAMPEGESCD